jgi:hypothetical protein
MGAANIGSRVKENLAGGIKRFNRCGAKRSLVSRPVTSTDAALPECGVSTFGTSISGPALSNACPGLRRSQKRFARVVLPRERL